MGAINLPHFEGSFPPLRENIRPAQVSKPTCRELRHHHVVLTAGTVADQQFPVLSSAHHDPHMGIIRVEGQIAGLGLGLENQGVVSILGGSSTIFKHPSVCKRIKVPIPATKFYLKDIFIVKGKNFYIQIKEGSPMQ